MQSLILIKLGGSLITDKSKKNTINKKNLDIACLEIKKARDLGIKLIVAHGQGSFAHIPAKYYQTNQGIINKKSYKGISLVASQASKLNRIIVDRMIIKGINAFSINPSSIMTAKNHILEKFFTDSVEQLLKHDLTPVLYGDQIIDESKGCTIFSAEKVLNNLALKLKGKFYESRREYKIQRIIHSTNIDGVFDSDNHIIRLINSKNFNKYKKYIKGSENTDVTGGMLHKVEQSLELAKKNIPAVIINGSKKDNLLKAITNQKVLGTKIIK